MANNREETVNEKKFALNIDNDFQLQYNIYRLSLKLS